MSYCRFQNTWSDLWDCVAALEDFSSLSKSEEHCAKRLRELCQRYLDAYDDWCEEKNGKEDDDGLL